MPLGNHPAGLGPEAHLSVMRKVSLSGLSRACRGEPVEETPKAARLPAAQNGAAPEAGLSAKQSASRATTFFSTEGRPSGLCTPPCYKAGPCYPVNDATIRLCGAGHFASGAIRSRLEAVPTAFFLTEPTARRQIRPYPRSQQVVHAQCGLTKHHIESLCKRPNPDELDTTRDRHTIDGALR
jgi:hypothetical protein